MQKEIVPIKKIARDGYESLGTRAVQRGRIQLIDVNQEASYRDDSLDLALPTFHGLPGFGGLSERHFNENFLIDYGTVHTRGPGRDRTHG